MFSPADTMESDEEKKKLKQNRIKTLQRRENTTAKRLKIQPKQIKTENIKYIPSSRRIQLFPTKRQERILKDWNAAVRKTWNSALILIDHYNFSKENVLLRNRLVIKKQMEKAGINLKNISWLFRTPKRVREYAIIDLVSSIKAAETKIKRRRISKYKIQPKTKDKIQNICISHEMIQKLDGKTITFSGMKIKTDTELLDDITHNMRLQSENGCYYLYIPVFKSDEELKKRKSGSGIVALDPGIRKFLSFYSPRGECGTVEGFEKQLEQKMKQLEKSRTTKRKLRIHRRIKFMRDDIHWKLSHYFLSKFQTILIPRLYVCKGIRKIKDQMKFMKHCLFVDRLQQKSLEYPGSRIVVCKEYYTSITCGNCGKMNRKLKGSETFSCDCGLVVDRDIHAARNILLSNLK